MTPSTDRHGRRKAPRALFAGAAVSTVAILTACSRASSVVEAPMTSIDASAAAIALVNDPRPSPQPPDKNLLIHVGERFVGRYVCGQGPTDLTIKLDTIGHGEGEVEVEATAEFNYDGSTGHAEAEGSFRAVGIFDPRTRRLHLKGDTWIDRPSGYGLVNFVGTVSKKGETYSGSVEGAGCGSFTTTREDVGD